MYGGEFCLRRIPAWGKTKALRSGLLSKSHAVNDARILWVFLLIFLRVFVSCVFSLVFSCISVYFSVSVFLQGFLPPGTRPKRSYHLTRH